MMDPMVIKKINKKETIRLHTYILGIYFLISPLEDVLSFEVGTLAKYVSILFLFAVIPFLYINKVKIITKKNMQLCVFPFMMIILAWLSCFWSISFQTSFSRNISYTTLPLLFIIIYCTPFNPREYRYVLNMALLGGILVFIIIVFEMGFSQILSKRLTLNASNDPNNLAALLLLPLCISIGKFYDFKLHKIKPIYFLVGIPVFFIFLITGSRGGVLSLVVFLISYLWLTSVKTNFYGIIKIIIIISIIAYFIIRLLPEGYILRLFSKESYINAATSSGQRGQIWKNIFKYIIPELPIYGYGSGCSFIALSWIYGHLKGVHNTYLNMLIQYGIFGLPLFIAFIIKVFKTLLKEKSSFEIAMLLGILCTIFFLDSYAKKFFWNILYLLAIFLRSNSSEIMVRGKR